MGWQADLGVEGSQSVVSQAGTTPTGAVSRRCCQSQCNCDACHLSESEQGFGAWPDNSTALDILVCVCVWCGLVWCGGRTIHNVARM